MYIFLFYKRKIFIFVKNIKMREKLLTILKTEGLKSSQMAERLEINPAAISHILSGRNKPGFDLLQKILRKFPNINPDWLLLDSPQMYREPKAPIDPKMKNGLFADVPISRIADHSSSESPAVQSAVSSSQPSSLTQRSGQIARIVIFYTDHTCEEFRLKEE